ncbi:diacylglycerol/lipid kinase family protein [Deinococcus arboris]|uniref:diacylglycerol/lipid kinase family protein n=1 Tax=Deinococcus arboris TaxID=2682977 RepID=UPI0034E28B51
MTSESGQLVPASLPPLAVVLNPQAGGGLALREWPRLEAELQRRGLAYTLIHEESGEAALARVAALPADMAVMAVGGDGTVGALLSAVVGTGRPLAIVPLGTGNDFAGLLGLRPGQFGEALDRLHYQPRALDAMQVSIVQGDEAGRTVVLLNGMGMGFDADVTANMDTMPARLRGLARYVASALSTLRHLKLARVEVVADGQTLYAGPSPLAAVMNGTRYGGGFLISPQSDVRDGLLNVVVGGPMTRGQLLGLMARVLRGAHLGHPLAHHTQAREVQVTWDTPTRLHLDGDLHGRVTALQVRVLPGATLLLNA